MATITCFSQTNLQGYSNTYNTDQPDLTKDFPNGIHSAQVEGNAVIVYPEINYQGVGAVLEVGIHNFPPGTVGFKSLKVTTE